MGDYFFATRGKLASKIVQHLLSGGETAEDVFKKMKTLTVDFVVMPTNCTKYEDPEHMFEYELVDSTLYGIDCAGFMNRFDNDSIIMVCDSYGGGCMSTCVIDNFSSDMLWSIDISSMIWDCVNHIEYAAANRMLCVRWSECENENEVIK